MLIASGPTREPLDPVRFISNYSTGTMGRCLVDAARRRGHRVTWVRCPEPFGTAQALQSKLRKELPRHDILIMAAAVCDVRPARTAAIKTKKEALWNLPLVRNPDILAGLGRRKHRRQVFVGFGLESSALVRNGLKKLRQKNLDLIVLQGVTARRSPFGRRPVDAVLVDYNRTVRRFQSVSKQQLSRLILDEAEKRAEFLRTARPQGRTEGCGCPKVLARWPRS